MRKLLIVAAIMLVASSSAWAKLHVLVTVAISDEKLQRELREGLEARLNSTERYTVTTDAVITNLSLTVHCLVLADQSGYKTGIACHNATIYFPYKDSALREEVEDAEGMVAAPPDNTAHIVDQVMIHFINGTTDQILTEKKNFLRTKIQYFCANEPTESKMPRP